MATNDQNYFQMVGGGGGLTTQWNVPSWDATTITTAEWTVPQDYHTIKFNPRTIARGDATMSCNTEKKPRVTYYEYILRVVDLSYKEIKNTDRILLKVEGHIELRDGSNIKDSVLVKHAADLAKVTIPDDSVVEVEVQKHWLLVAKD